MVEKIREKVPNLIKIPSEGRNPGLGSPKTGNFRNFQFCLAALIDHRIILEASQVVSSVNTLVLIMKNTLLKFLKLSSESVGRKNSRKTIKFGQNTM